MSRVVTASQVETAALEGRRELTVPDGTVVTPLASDRAAALGVSLVGDAADVDLAAGPSVSKGNGPSSKGNGPRPSRRRARDGLDVERLVLESKIRILARGALLRNGHGLGDLEDLVTAVMIRLYAGEQASPACRCDEGR